MQKINVAIIGSGNMAQQHLNVINSFKEFNIICVLGRNKNKLKNFAKKNLIKNYLFDIDLAYKKFRPDIVIVAISEISLIKVIEKIIKYPWLCLCEKPVGINYNETQVIYKKIQQFKKKNFFVSLNRRFYYGTLCAKKILKNFKGKIEIHINDQLDRNMLKRLKVKKKLINNYMYANSVHLIDYINIFCRGKPVSIKNINLLNKKPKILISKIKFSSGDEVTYTVVYDVMSPWYVVIKANKKIITLKPLENFFLSNKKEILDKGINLIDEKFKPGLKRQAFQILNYFNKKKYYLTPIQNYLKTVSLIKKIYEK
jgi:predicted dehydrogenase